MLTPSVIINSFLYGYSTCIIKKKRSRIVSRSVDSSKLPARSLDPTRRMWPRHAKAADMAPRNKLEILFYISMPIPLADARILAADPGQQPRTRWLPCRTKDFERNHRYGIQACFSSKLDDGFGGNAVLDPAGRHQCLDSGDFHNFHKPSSGA